MENGLKQILESATELVLAQMEAVEKEERAMMAAMEADPASVGGYIEKGILLAQLKGDLAKNEELVKYTTTERVRTAMVARLVWQREEIERLVKIDVGEAPKQLAGIASNSN